MPRRGNTLEVVSSVIHPGIEWVHVCKQIESKRVVGWDVFPLNEQSQLSLPPKEVTLGAAKGLAP